MRLDRRPGVALQLMETLYAPVLFKAFPAALGLDVHVSSISGVSL